MWIALFSVLFGFLIIGLIVVIGVYSWQKEKKRTAQMQVTGGQLGWSFMAQAPLNMIPGLERFTLFTQGHRKEIKNMMYGEANGARVAVF